MAVARPASGRWLFGPVPDLLLGCGGLYALVLLAFAVFGAELRGAEAAWLGPLLVLLLGAPHYGATLLRVYEHREDRRAYAIFAVHATLLVAAAFGLGLFVQPVAAWLVTIYLTWSPWHYTGQNYGLAVMFLRRRGVDVTPAAKRLLYLSFILSFVLTFLLFHGQYDSAPTPEFAAGPRSYFVSLGIPTGVTEIAFPVILLAYAGVLGGAAVLLLRGGSARDLVPTAVMAVSQALWFSVPVALRYWRLQVGIEPLRWDLRDYYFFWIALGHATQYLWITTYYARRSQSWHGYHRYLLKILVAGTAIWTLPVILFDPARVGFLPNSAALALLVASAVNIHHFILDGAIWKLRHSRVANVLIRSGPERRADAPRPGFGWKSAAVWATAFVGCALAGFKYVHEDVLFPRAVEARDFAAARRILERIDWLHHVSDDARERLGRAESSYARLRRAYDRRLERRMGLAPDPDAADERAGRGGAPPGPSGAQRAPPPRR